MQSTFSQNNPVQSGAPLSESSKLGHPSSNSEIGQLEADISQLENLLGSNKDKDQTELINKIKELGDENRINTESKIRINDKIRFIESRLDKSSNGDKSDAFSVFGSFQGAAKGDGKSADINLGKIFSTGVAAQILTEGIGKGTELGQRTICVEKFIASAQQLKNKTDSFSIEQSLSIMADAIKLCSSATDNTKPEPRSSNN